MSNLPDLQGCLNLLHAIYACWWRDARRNPDTLAELADWIDQPIDLVRHTRPAPFRTNRKDDLHDDHHL